VTVVLVEQAGRSRGDGGAPGYRDLTPAVTEHDATWETPYAVCEVGHGVAAEETRPERLDDSRPLSRSKIGFGR
jgi:hypothetical protein